MEDGRAAVGLGLVWDGRSHTSSTALMQPSFSGLFVTARGHQGRSAVELGARLQVGRPARLAGHYNNSTACKAQCSY